MRLWLVQGPLHPWRDPLFLEDRFEQFFLSSSLEDGSVSSQLLFGRFPDGRGEKGEKGSGPGCWGGRRPPDSPRREWDLGSGVRSSSSR